jgi:predicted kinase
MDDVPRFVVVAGPPCSGKSFVASYLSAQFSAPHLEMDRFRERVLPFSEQCVEHRDVAYRAMHFTAELMAPFRSLVVMDATYTASACRTDLMSVVERLGASLCVFECHVSAQTAVERFLRRGRHPAVDLNAARVARLALAYPYFGSAFAIGEDAGAAGDLSRATQYLRSDPPGLLNRRHWCRHGQPREKGQGHLSAARVAP